MSAALGMAALIVGGLGAFLAFAAVVDLATRGELPPTWLGGEDL